MMHKHNRHMSIAVYISVLAIADNITLIFGEWLSLESSCTSNWPSSGQRNGEQEEERTSFHPKRNQEKVILTDCKIFPCLCLLFLSFETKMQNLLMKFQETFFHFLLPVQDKASQSCFFESVSPFSGFLIYLGQVHRATPKDSTLFCNFRITVTFTSSLAGVLVILAMTFDRFFGIIKPHLAASFNTVKRARITCLLIIIFSILYDIPHIFTTLTRGYDCVPYGKAFETVYGEIYYWLSFVINYSFPFAALLAMNSVIIHTIRTRQDFSAGGNKGARSKSADSQVFAILLLVTFSFLTLITPAYMLFLFQKLVDFKTNPTLLAGWHLFYSSAQKLYHTNNGINFFLYILSGTKFRNDFLQLFGCTRKATTTETGSTNTLNTSVGEGEIDLERNTNFNRTTK